MNSIRAAAVALGLILAVGIETTRHTVNSAEPATEDASVVRTRKQVRMLDDVYKGGIVLVTDTYAEDKNDIPAGTVFKKLFAIAKEKGWHEVRLLDATGEPYNEENAPKAGFEQRAIKDLLAGKTYVEEIVEIKGQRFLRAATPIPVVMDKCILCHENYRDVPAGQPIGALGYEVPIE